MNQIEIIAETFHIFINAIRTGMFRQIIDAKGFPYFFLSVRNYFRMRSIATGIFPGASGNFLR